MKKLNYHRIIQWVMFMPIILPLSIISGALDGIRLTLERVVHQIQNDIVSQ